MKIIISLLIVAAVVTGCAEWNVIKQSTATYTAMAADESVKVTRWKHCNAETVGAIKRFYNTGQKIAVYNQFCAIDDGDSL